MFIKYPSYIKCNVDKKTYIFHVTGFGNQEGKFTLSVYCEGVRRPSVPQELKCLESVTNTTIGVPNVKKAGYFGVTHSTSCVLLYSLSNITGEVKLSTCHDQKTFDSLIKVFQDTVAGSCVAGNDDGDNWASDFLDQYRDSG